MTDVSAIVEPAVVNGVSGSARRRRQRLAAALAIIAVGLAIAVIRFGTAGDTRFSVGFDLPTFSFLGSIVLYPTVGALIIQRRPTTRVAWLMIGIGLALGAGLSLYGYGVVGMPPRPPLPGALTAIVLSQLFIVPALATGSALLFLLFPADRLLGPRWQAAVALSVTGSLLFVMGSLIAPGQLDAVNLPGVANPIGLPERWGDASGALVIVGNIGLIVSAAIGAASLVLRHRRGDPVQRAQIRWIALVGSLAAAVFAVAAFQFEGISDVAWNLGFAFLAVMPIAIGFAITRYRLYEIDRLINRTLVYGSLTAILAGIFTAGIGLAQRLFIATTGESSDAAIVLTTLVVATSYAPLRKRLEELVDRRFKYEHRRFGAYREEVIRILGLMEPNRAAERFVAEAVRELEATGGAVVDAAGDPIATAGVWPVPSVVRMAIPGSSGTLHAILVGPRVDGRPHDQRTISNLEETAGLVATAVGLTQPER
jgi:hypothetical protein